MGKVIKLSKNTDAPKSERSARGEWVGGCLSPAAFANGQLPLGNLPQLFAWLDLESGKLVHLSPSEKDDPGAALAETFLAALERCNEVELSPPKRVRVATPSAREEIERAAAKLSFSVKVQEGATPELDTVFEQLVATMLDASLKTPENGGYVQGCGLKEPQVRVLFDAAAFLYSIAPWTCAHESQTVRVDIPELGVKAACLSVIGDAGISRGLLLFESQEAFEQMCESAEEAENPADVAFVAPVLSVDFESKDDLVGAFMEEVKRHGWQLESPEAYPVLRMRGPAGELQAVTEQELQIATALCAGFVPFLLQNLDLFSGETAEPRSRTYEVAHGISIRFTAPYAAYRLFEPEGEEMASHLSLVRSPAPEMPPASAQATSKVGRNDPCPCGSGKKYKRCHLREDHAQDAPLRKAAHHHELDRELVDRLIPYASKHLGEDWKEEVEWLIDVSEGFPEFAVPWSLFHFAPNGETALDMFLSDPKVKLSSQERSWLEAQKRTWLSMWEVLDVSKGRSITLRDRLSGEEREIIERTGSQTLQRHQTILARVVDFEGVSVASGMFPKVLPPLAASEVEAVARKRLRRKTAVPLERLRPYRFADYLIEIWIEALDREIAIRTAPRKLCNTDGHEMLVTRDKYRFEQDKRSDVAEALAKLQWFEPEATERADEDPETEIFVLLRPGNESHRSWENTLIARMYLSRDKLELETNSRERADALKEEFDGLAPPHINYLGRSHEDPTSTAQAVGQATKKPQRELPDSEEMRAAVREHLEKHYMALLDDPLHPLGGLSPREACRTKDGKRRVEALLKEWEYNASKQALDTPIDFRPLRKSLGL